MSAGNITKRTCFEILFFILFPLLMSWYLAFGFVLLIRESFKTYPSEIYEFTKRIVYGKEDS